ncbi:hypothetical protein D9M70_524380 [compost metagenome]
MQLETRQVVMQRHRHHRAFEDAVVDRRGTEDQRRQGRARPAEQDLGELRHREPAGDGVTGDDGVDGAVAEHRQHQADDGVQGAVAHGQGGGHHQVEHRAADAPPGHGQGAAA